MLSFVVAYLDNSNISYNRTINNFVAELTLHSFLYHLNLYKDNTKDADLEYQKDSRWYVRTMTIVFQITSL